MLSNWLPVYQGKGGFSNLICLLVDPFHNFGIPETLTSDGGPESEKTGDFLRKLGIKHRMSSVGFLYANQKAERSVGAAKRLLRDVIKPSGEIYSVALIKGLLNFAIRQIRTPASHQLRCCWEENYVTSYHRRKAW